MKFDNSLKCSMEGKKMSNIMTVRAPEDLQKNLSEVAKKQGLTRNALILHILWGWIKKKEEGDGEEIHQNTG